MLSILIPIYNFDVRKFVKELHLQCKKANVEFEIILVDDASKNKFQELNKVLEKLKFVNYIQLKENIGRSKIRNLLAEKAKYEYLLFADCDTFPSDENFIIRYLENCKNNKVICGGITYYDKKPASQKEYLRWFYGKNREVRKANERNLYPNKSFMTGNYLINKLIQDDIKFNEKISQYGHEDTLFGIELKRKNIIVKHIDNPIIHLGLETCSEFIEKTKKSIENLLFLTENFTYSELYEDIKLLKVYRKTAKFSFLFKIYFKIFKKITEKKLCSNSPSLKLFDLYKLAYLHTIKNK